MESLPIEVKAKVFREVDSNIRLRSYGEVGVFNFFLVDVDWYVCAFEVLQSTGVIEMQVTHYNGFHVFYIMSGLLNLGW